MTKANRSTPIVVVGSANTDLIVHARRLPGPGETVLGGEFSRAAGGKGANQAVTVALAGGRVSFIGRIGTDSLGKRLLAEMRGVGVSVSHVVRDDRHASGVALICVNPAGENAIVVAGGSNAHLSAKDVIQPGSPLHKAGVLLVQLEIPLPAVEKAVDTVKAGGGLIVLNPAPARALSDTLLSKVDFLTPNEHEASLLTDIHVAGVRSAKKAAAVLRGRGVGAVIVTLGGRGVYVSSNEHEGLLPGFKVKVVDTTAAGDVFNGALAVRLAEKAPFLEAVCFAQAAAALSVTKAGAQPSIPKRTEIDCFLRRQVSL